MTLPVKQSTYSGLAEINSLLRVEKNTLLIEYQLQDELFGIFKSGVKSLSLKFESIEKIDTGLKNMLREVK